MWKKRGFFVLLILQLLLVLLLNCFVCSSGVISYDQTPSGYGSVGRLLKKEERFPVVSTEFGAVSAVDVGDGTGRHNFHLQFITLEPNSLFLPVLLHSQMVFYVQTGSGRLSWADPDKGELKTVELQRGDVYRLKSGSLFYVHSGLPSDRPRLRLIAIFAEDDEIEFQEPFVGPYSSINDLIRGFDSRVLQSAFQVPEEVIEELTSATDTPAIVHADTQEKKKKRFWEKDIQFLETLLGLRNYNREATQNKKKHSKSKAFNFFKGDPDFHNCNGWSKVVTKHDLDALHGSHIGVFMVNLTKGAMMGPHWNPMGTEVSIVLEGEGMVGIVCPSTLTDKECKNSRFRVEEGDVFTVPRFHPMAQMSFNNGSFVFMGFSTTTKKNHPQFLAGKASVLRTLDKLVLGASFNVSNTTIVDQLLAAQEESVILECTSCAEEEEVLMEKEIEEQRQEEEERRREEEERRRQEEEEKKREEEERKRKEEERRRREEEEERRRQEEEERKKREEEEEKRREEEEARKRQEEEERRRQEEEEEEERRKQEEEQRRQEEEEVRRREEEQRRREKEEEEQRRRQAEEEEEEARQKEQEEEARRREEEQRRQEEEEAARRQREQEEEWRREQEEQRRAGKERRRRREEERGRGEEESEEEAARREEQERIEWERRQEEETERRRRREHKHEPEPEFEWELVKMEDQSTEDGKLGHVGTTRRRSLNA